jgi:hypothetical protein
MPWAALRGEVSAASDAAEALPRRGTRALPQQGAATASPPTLRQADREAVAEDVALPLACRPEITPSASRWTVRLIPSPPPSNRILEERPKALATAEGAIKFLPDGGAHSAVGRAVHASASNASRKYDFG